MNNKNKNWIAEALLDLQQSVRGYTVKSEIAEVVAKFLLKYLSSKAVVICLIENSNIPKLQEIYSTDEKFTAIINYQANINAVKKTVENKRINEFDLHVDNCYIELDNTDSEYLVIVPLILEDKIEAVIELLNYKRLTEEEREFFSIISKTIVYALTSKDRILQNDEITKKLSAEYLDLVRTQENLLKKTEISEQESEIKTNFLNNVSHELRTPLNSLLIFSGNLLKNRYENLNENQLNSLNIIYHNAKDLLKLVSEILDLAKMKSGKETVSVEKIYFSDLIYYIDNLFGITAENKNLQFTIITDSTLPEYFFTDRIKITRILTNLISNAIKFTDKGGITVEFKYRANDDKKYYRRPIVISIADTGIGIPAYLHKSIFEPFRQADGSSTRNYEGTGLGLSIVKNLVNILEGKIVVNSTQLSGSVFSVYLKEKLKNEGREIEKTKQFQELNFKISKEIEWMQPGLDSSQIKTFLMIGNDLELNRRVGECFLSEYIDIFHLTANDIILSSDGSDDGFSLNRIKIKGIKFDTIFLNLCDLEENVFILLNQLDSIDELRHVPITALIDKKLDIKSFSEVNNRASEIVLNGDKSFEKLLNSITSLMQCKKNHLSEIGLKLIGD